MEVEASVPDRDVEVALEVAEGETLAVIGPNGAGKSTVLSVVGGLLRPARGHVRLDGRVLTDDRTFVPPHGRRVALLAQDPLLFPHLSVRDNVAFGPRSGGAGRRTSREAAHRWLAEVGVEELAGRRPREVSGGEGQRVALARALAAEPRLLLLDEPMAALDVAVQPALRQTLRRVLAGRTTVLVTHDVLDALLLADRVVVMEGGRIVEAGRTADVLERPRSAFAARIAGLNMVRGPWLDGAVSGIRGIATGPAPGAGEPAVAVFRPSAVAVYREAPAGSPRNSLPVTITEVEPHGDAVRVRADHLAADVTPLAAAELELAPGLHVVFSVKATEVSVYRI
nr:ATP-binding cassette domain-containing protein [Nocardioides sp. MAH-18]